MKNHITYSLLIIGLLFSNISFAQQSKVEVIGYSKNPETPIPFLKTDKSGKMIYDPRVIGSPKFFDGYIITVAGERIEGKVAVFNNSQDWNFVKRALLIVPKGSEQSQYLKAGAAIEIFQQKKKENITYDYYDGIFLERLVSGPLRLYYNPAANTSRPISSFVSQTFIDSVQNKVIKQSIETDLENGASIQESLEKAQLKKDAIDAFASIEIVDKEYLLFDSKMNENLLVTKSNYPSLIEIMSKECSQVTEKEGKKFAKSYKDIEEVIQAFNTRCMN